MFVASTTSIGSSPSNGTARRRFVSATLWVGSRLVSSDGSFAMRRSANDPRASPSRRRASARDGPVAVRARAVYSRGGVGGRLPGETRRYPQCPAQGPNPEYVGSDNGLLPWEAATDVEAFPKLARRSQQVSEAAAAPPAAPR